jgi:hypothetical protein
MLALTIIPYFGENITAFDTIFASRTIYVLVRKPRYA